METERTKAEAQRDADRSDRERVQRYYHKALGYQTSDPAAALGQARKAAEAICKHILNKNNSNPGKATLQQLIEKLTSEGLLPPIILPPLQTIQRYGNFGAHDQERESDEITAEYIQPCMSALFTAVKWYLDVCNPVPNVEVDTAPQPISASHK